MNPNLPDLRDERALVTGASQGVGEGIARVLAGQGAEVIITYEPKRVFERRALTVVRELSALGAPVSAEPLDLADKRSIDRLVRHVWKRPVTALVNNAFWWNPHIKRFEEQTFEDLRRFALIDFAGITYLTQKMLVRMRQREIPGTVVNITSVHQETVRRMHPPYSALKAALAMVTKELAVEYGPYGIRVNNIAPGHVETDPEKVKRGTRARNRFIPLRGRSALPEDIGNMVAVLVSRQVSGHVTGTTIFVDGGERLFSEWVAKIPPGA